jgi:hypothetical protein
MDNSFALQRKVSPSQCCRYCTGDLAPGPWFPGGYSVSVLSAPSPFLMLDVSRPSISHISLCPDVSRCRSRDVWEFIRFADIEFRLNLIQLIVVLALAPPRNRYFGIPPSRLRVAQNTSISRSYSLLAPTAVQTPAANNGPSKIDGRHLRTGHQQWNSNSRSPPKLV